MLPKKIGLKFYSFWLLLFLLLALHLQMQTRAEQAPPPLPAASSAQLWQKHSSLPISDVSEGQQVICKEQDESEDSRPLFAPAVSMGICVVSRRNKHRAAAHARLVLCDSAGSITSCSKSCLLSLSLWLMPRCLSNSIFQKLIKILCNAP